MESLFKDFQSELDIFFSCAAVRVIVQLYANTKITLFSLAPKRSPDLLCTIIIKYKNKVVTNVEIICLICSSKFGALYRWHIIGCFIITWKQGQLIASFEGKQTILIISAPLRCVSKWFRENIINVHYCMLIVHLVYAVSYYSRQCHAGARV